jgi:hypothetical protein
MKLWPVLTLFACLHWQQPLLRASTNLPPALQVYPAMEVMFTAASNTVYQLQVSMDTELWTNAGPQITGTGELISQLYSTRGQPHLFQRLTVVSSDAIRTNAPGTLSGKIIDFKAADGALENLTFATAKWVRSSIEGTGTYQYGLNGNVGALQVSFPSGTTYTLQLLFNSDGQGGAWEGTQFYDQSDHAVAEGATFVIEN